MRIKKITLENFRCFQKQELDLSADVVAIYGRNGTGKTAIFDALEWALLGEIGRYAGETSAPDYLAHVFTEGNPTVRVDFDEGPDWIEVTRERGRSSGGELSCGSGHTTHRDFLYSSMLNPDYSGPRREVAPVRDFLRSAALLSQDSIRGFVENTPEGRTSVLAYIAGSATHQRRLDRAKEVQRCAESRSRSKGEEVKEAEASVAELNAKVAERDARIRELHRGIEAPSSFRDVLNALQKAGVECPDGLAHGAAEDAETVAATVRGLCEERSVSLARRRTSLAKLEAMSQQHPARVKRRQELMAMARKAELRLKELLDGENTATARMTDAERSLPPLNENTQKLSSRLAALQELPRLVRQRASQQHALRDLEAKREGAERSLREAKENAERQHAALVRSTSEIATRQATIEQLSQREALLEELVSTLNSYESAVRQADLAQETIERLVRDQEGIEKELADARTQHSAAQEQVGVVTSALASRQAATERAQQLLVQIKELVTGRECPLCGQEYQSVAELQKAIQEQMGAVPSDIKDLGKRLQEQSAVLSQVGASRDKFEDDLYRIRGSLRAEEQRRKSATESVRRFHASAAKAGVPPEAEPIGSALKDVKEHLANQRRELEGLERNTHAQTATEARAREDANRIEAELAAMNQETGQVTANLNTIGNRIEELGLLGDVEKPETEVAQSIESLRAQLAEHQESKQRLLASAAEARAEREASRNERERLEADMKEWESTLARLGDEVDEFRTMSRTLGLPEEPSAQSVAALRGQLDDGSDRLGKAQRMAEGYYRSSRAAALERDRNVEAQQLNSVGNRLRGLRKELADLRAAARTAKGWIGPLTNSVGRMVEARIKAHRDEVTRLFKGIIPTPYMFGGILIGRDAMGVHLGLRYRGQSDSSGEPRFFLSSAQANVLALAIFLSLAGQQRWSRLTTVMLDDPVQHLDDLDAVAFLDCLRSLINPPGGERKQLLLSTCDKNLYLLIIRKFLPLTAGGLSLTGISLLDAGTQGPQVCYDIGGPEGVSLPAQAV